jgi:transposase
MLVEGVWPNAYARARATEPSLDVSTFSAAEQIRRQLLFAPCPDDWQDPLSHRLPRRDHGGGERRDRAGECAPFSDEVELLDTIPGVNRRVAEVLIAEIGAEMDQFPTHYHLASWAGMCPGNDESAGKRRSGKTRKGSKWLRSALIGAAHAAAKAKGTHLSGRYARIKGIPVAPRKPPWRWATPSW